MQWSYGAERYRHATIRDLPAIVDLLSDPEVGRWLWFTPLPPEGIEAYFRPLLDAQAEARPRKVAIRFEGAEITYRGLVAAGQGAAALLDDHGLEEGDHVAWLGPNHPLMIALLYACSLRGCALVPLTGLGPLRR